MAARKIKDIAVKTGEYTDRNSGQIKGRFQNVGALMKNEDGSVFIILERWFNPAGIADPQNRGSVLLSCFDLKDQSGQAQGGQSQQQGGGYAEQSGGGLDRAERTQRDLDDQIPF